jgi:LPXTG-site transpeptidase (sortase) family protein
MADVPKFPRRVSLGLGLCLAGALSAGAVWLAHIATDDADPAAPAPTTATLPAGTEPSTATLPAGTQPSTVTRTPSPTVSPPTSASVPFGQAGAPLHLEIAAIGVAAEVVAYTAEHAATGYDAMTGEVCYRDGTIVCIDPPTLDQVYWQRGGLDGIVNGDMPGTASRGTVYFYGHAGANAGAVFDHLPELEVGATATVSTLNGTLTYRVAEVFTVPKDQFTTDPRITAQVAGQLLLVSCDHSPGAGLAGGGYATHNVVARLQVESAGPPAG